MSEDCSGQNMGSQYNPLSYPQDFGLQLLSDATYIAPSGAAITVACWTDKTRPGEVLCDWDAYDADKREPFDGCKSITTQGTWISNDTFERWLHWMNVTVTLRFHVAVKDVRQVVEAVATALGRTL